MSGKTTWLMHVCYTGHLCQMDLKNSMCDEVIKPKLFVHFDGDRYVDLVKIDHMCVKLVMLPFHLMLYVACMPFCGNHLCYFIITTHTLFSWLHTTDFSRQR